MFKTLYNNYTINKKEIIHMEKIYNSTEIPTSNEKLIETYADITAHSYSKLDLTYVMEFENKKYLYVKSNDLFHYKPKDLHTIIPALEGFQTFSGSSTEYRIPKTFFDSCMTIYSKGLKDSDFRITDKGELIIE